LARSLVRRWLTLALLAAVATLFVLAVCSTSGEANPSRPIAQAVSGISSRCCGDGDPERADRTAASATTVRSTATAPPIAVAPVEPLARRLFVRNDLSEALDLAVPPVSSPTAGRTPIPSGALTHDAAEPGASLTVKPPAGSATPDAALQPLSTIPASLTVGAAQAAASAAPIHTAIPPGAEATTGGMPTPAPTTTAGVTATTTPTSDPNAPTVPVIVKFKLAAEASDMDRISARWSKPGRDVSQLRIRVVQVPQGSLDASLAAIGSDPAVDRASAAVRLQVAATPNDPMYQQQWSLPHVAWDQAYEAVPISGSARIAVLDTGIDSSHPDLAALIDPGQSFVGQDPNQDPNGHGTAMAGIAAARVNNGAGMAGVAYGGATLSSVQVLGPDGSGWDADVVSGVVWAADDGAKVILMAFSSPQYSAALADAISYANSKGIVVVAATGNGGSSESSYPAGMPNVIGVAASNSLDQVAGFSNTGSPAVAAPGEGINATAPGGGYTLVSGTSAASAEVAGLAAMLAANGSNAAAQIRGASDPIAGRSFGRINVGKALGAAVTPVETATIGVTPTPAGTPIYTAAAVPAVTGISPTSGPAAGGTSLAITGSSFTGGHGGEVRGHQRQQLHGEQRHQHHGGRAGQDRGNIRRHRGHLWRHQRYQRQ